MYLAGDRGLLSTVGRTRRSKSKERAKVTSRSCWCKSSPGCSTRGPLGFGHGPVRAHAGPKNSPSRLRFRPPNRLIFRLRVRPLGWASTYSRPVLGARGNLDVARGAHKPRCQRKGRSLRSTDFPHFHDFRAGLGTTVARGGWALRKPALSRPGRATDDLT